MGISVQHKNFVRFLDRNYCITVHLIERLDELRESALFTHLQGLLLVAIGVLEAQSLNADKLYGVLRTRPSFTANGPLISLLEHAFSGLPSYDDGSQYACLLDYISLADALMATNAKLADLSLTVPERLSLPLYQLYEALTLEPLITALSQAGLVVV